MTSDQLEERAGGITTVVQRFRHGPGISFVRMAVDRGPEGAGAIAQARCASLRSGMVAALAAARRLLDHGSVGRA